jgi:hypothetical protein
MVASRRTVDAVLEVARKYLDEDSLTAMLHDMAEVEGNGSFRATIMLLLLERRRTAPRRKNGTEGNTAEARRADHASALLRPACSSASSAMSTTYLHTDNSPIG